MNIQQIFLNKFFLLFLLVFFGTFICKIKIRGHSIGASASLFVGIAISYFAISYAMTIPQDHISYQLAQTLISDNIIHKDFFTVFLIIFIASVGLLASKNIKQVFKKYGLKFIALGFFITFIGAFITFILTKNSGNYSPYEVSGVYTGALTSSPGLGAAIEASGTHANEVSVGHILGYPFGVIIILLSMSLLPKLFRIDINTERKRHEEEMGVVKNSKINNVQEVSFDMVAFIFVVLVGYFIGSIKVNLPFLGIINLGSTGGVLIIALVCGYKKKILFMNFNMEIKTLNILRDIGLTFVLAIIGLRYGYAVIDAITGTGWYLAIISIIIASITLMCGFLLGRYVFKINWILLSGALCGGMTSTPGLSVAIESLESNEPAAGYGATYPFALIGMVMFTIILHSIHF